ncbi:MULTISPECIES: HWE histidine kinase domain-containing protein [unclassified Bradyrhizobium]|uniref:CHASE domain-containing protein n=1 Tax=unclassified Bradyrhizobium TaxID=2631580 RepID=UPI001BA7BAF9|nr:MULTISPECIES: HWE histidine kinase domain-containing protein [unclassified Bradyrhizobium]MBR1271462.1 CHASE domain-containing protein [Bradyrhizobium sp. AUGA SZCCT0222]MBR1285061.1 CHASE domain-containing protein [Bradyrhizobium sp. AUGA SZCCT0177]MBR1224642.1 CHASE domain-containing protein [Bradyrhizobium sp. AUGA SZCCT0176]MBR1234201.1 CHASE domain-containing protein [Bradyrhizobium sp. AUGA SZCCT0182]MBR1299877.1 CHASE domain-containing protein [Bradyrhizobium sp. AUGA SZCCT0042]
MVRLGFIIGFIALIGGLLSGLAAYRVHEQEVTLDGIALARAIDVHASLVQDRLTERELLARVASGLFRAPSVLKANMLQPLRASIYAFKTDFVVANWIARLKPDELEAARAVLKSSGFTDPTIRDFDDRPLDMKAIDKPINVLMDLEPRSADTLSFPGRAYDRHSIIGPVLTQVMEGGKPVASDPIPLLRKDGPVGIVLAAPVYQEGSSEAAGFVTFSYELATLMLTNDDRSLFAVVLKDPSDANDEFVANDQGAVTLQPVRPEGPAPSMVRTVTFGGRDWSLGYYAKTNVAVRAQQTAVIVAAIGLALTGIVCGLFGYVAYNNLRLSREIQVRIGFERRLTAVIDELNHRVKNILAVIQSIVTRTLRHGSDIDVSRELLIGRIHAMSNVVTLLSESQWQGVKLKGLFEARAIPHADRIAVNGPDIAVSARAAQSLSLLFFELASHSDEGLSLVGKHPHIVANWEISGEEPDTVFHFRWEEFNTSAATRREDSDFGLILLDRVAPEALGGTAKRFFTDVSYVYELTAPMVTVVDMTERDRTEQLSAPVRPVK